MADNGVGGSCLCGAVGYQITGNLGIFQYCHCSRCRKFTGSAHSANLLVRPDQFRWLRGEDRVGRFEPSHTRHFATAFCRDCGASLPWLAKTGKAVVVPAGTLDTHPGIEPLQNVFHASRAPWFREAGSLPRHDELPRGQPHRSPAGPRNEGTSGTGILTDDMKRVVNEQRLGFVATIDADGTPNLSPKGTMVILDHDHIAFGEIRSPNTVRNLRNRPAVEVNFVDPTARKGYRFKGTAEIIGRGEVGFDALLPAFERWGELAGRIRAVVRIRVERARPLTSPAYDDGASETELRRNWLRHLHAIQPGEEPAE